MDKTSFVLSITNLLLGIAVIALGIRVSALEENSTLESSRQRAINSNFQLQIIKR